MTTPTIVAFLQYLGLGIIFPQLPFQALALGASPQTVTYLLVTDLVAVALFAPIWGRLSDRFGRNPILLIGLAFSPVSYAALAQAQTLEVMFLARICSGAGIAAITVLQAHIAEKTSTESRTSGMARVNGAYALAFVVGPLIAAAGALNDAEAIYERIGLIAAGLTGISLPLAALCLRDRAATFHQYREPSVSHDRSGVRRQLGKSTLIPMGVLVSLTMVYAGMSATIGVWAAHTLAWETRELSLAFAATGTAAVVAQLALVSRLANRVGERSLAVGGGALLFAGSVLLATWPTPFSAVTGMAVMGAGLAIAFSCLQSVISLTVSANTFGALLGTMHSAVSVARILGPVLGGLFLANFGLSSPYVCGAILALAATVLLQQVKSPSLTEKANQVREGSRNVESSLLP